ncbi:MAG: hypothetical protein ACYCVG_01350 [Leptospirillum sp.]|jgi:hypothetical protein
MKIDPTNAHVAYLNFKDDHVELVAHAAAKALSELHGASYEYKELSDGWIGFRVQIDPERVKARVDNLDYVPRVMVVSFEKENFNFRGEL